MEFPIHPNFLPEDDDKKGSGKNLKNGSGKNSDTKLKDVSDNAPGKKEGSGKNPEKGSGKKGW